MNSRRLILVSTFGLAVAAGLAVGVLASRLPSISTLASPAPHSQLAEQLQLTPEQGERMKTIWEGTKDSLDDCFSRARVLQQERDDAVVAILTAEQKWHYAKVNQAYVDKFAELTARRQATFQQAVDKTEQMLSDVQKKKYREILKGRMGRPGPFGPGAASGSAAGAME